IPATREQLTQWDGSGTPSQATHAAFAEELHGLGKERQSGKLAEELNRTQAVMSSMVKTSARRDGRLQVDELAQRGVETLHAAHRNWSKPETWRAIQRAGEIYTYHNYLTALDLEHTEQGIQARDTEIYRQLYGKTLKTALIITVLCALLGYPLAYYLASLPSNRANLLLVLVLLPFWTSLLVRTTAWIALLQTNGVINSFLLSTGLVAAPFEMLYTSFATVLA